MFRESILMLKLRVSKDSGSCAWMPTLIKEIVLWWFWGEGACECLSNCMEGTKILDRL